MVAAGGLVALIAAAEQLPHAVAVPMLLQVLAHCRRNSTPHVLALAVRALGRLSQRGCVCAAEALREAEVL